MKELSIEEKARRYDEAIEIAKSKIKNDKDHVLYEDDIIELFPELKESEDEKIRKEIISALKYANYKGVYDKHLAWLEKQGEHNKWKPSKEEMDALYGLAYITNKMDDKKDEAITKLYQDLKREFFNGASYENMFPSGPVDAPIKDEKQGKNNMGISEDTKQKLERNLNKSLEKETPESWNEFLEKKGEQKPAWSEEDENRINRLIAYFEDKESFTAEDDVVYANWLKSLRPQNTWKPSDEQMDMLKIAVSTSNSIVLDSLYNDLMKLKE